MLGAGGCTTLKYTAVNKLGDALASRGSVYASDNDPTLVRDAAPADDHAAALNLGAHACGHR